MSLSDTPIGATLTYKPHGAFLPRDLDFAWATPDDIVFVLAAFHARQGRGAVTRSELVSALEEARDSQMQWHADRMRLSLVQGLGWWVKVTPSRLVDRVVELAMRQYHESTAQWSMEMADLYEQVNLLHRKVDFVGRAEGRDVMTSKVAA
ncbi:hypothetical protein [Streptomyces sp. NPDC088727]|uniref:hypothetical protein n=1 Tax=Streptomyces sp. NPDC088727 TaxID=3365875 RepID=UPI00381867A1